MKRQRLTILQRPKQTKTHFVSALLTYRETAFGHECGLMHQPMRMVLHSIDTATRNGIPGLVLHFLSPVSLAGMQPPVIMTRIALYDASREILVVVINNKISVGISLMLALLKPCYSALATLSRGP
jgi:hypothetical protein